MKKKIIAACLALTTTAPLFAQVEAADFQQPYALGTKNNNENFTGDVWLSKIIQNDSLHLPAFNVTFAPGCINSWHYHTGGQVLIASAGTGYYQEKGKPARRLHAGEVVEIAPGTIHWHGAAPESWFAHIAMMPNIQTNKTIWLEPVGNMAYNQAVEESKAVYQAAATTLSPRQRAIVSLGSYTGHGDLMGLRSAIIEALEAGMTQNEVKEVLVHSYAYCGFPRALRALQTMMEVVKESEKAGKSYPVGREAKVIKTKGDKYKRGQEILSKLSGAPLNSKTAAGDFAPAIDTFLKEHLFADIFERDLLTYSERELATISILAGVGGVEPMLQSHLGICLHQGITPTQLNSVMDLLTFNLGQQYAASARQTLEKVLKR